MTLSGETQHPCLYGVEVLPLLAEKEKQKQTKVGIAE
jgi:hypothetical protein